MNKTDYRNRHAEKALWGFYDRMGVEIKRMKRLAHWCSDGEAEETAERIFELIEALKATSPETEDAILEAAGTPAPLRGTPLHRMMARDMFGRLPAPDERGDNAPTALPLSLS